MRNAGKGTVFSGAGPRKDLGGILGWSDGDSDVFRRVLAHPKLVPYLNLLCGKGYRMGRLDLLVLVFSLESRVCLV